MKIFRFSGLLQNSDFGWRSASGAAISPFTDGTLLASEVSSASERPVTRWKDFRENCQAMTDNGVREHGRTHLEKLHRLCLLEQALIAALNQPTVSLDMTEVRKKGLLSVLRRAR
jgi:hypothetical protein